MIGTVAWFDNKKGFGFIESAGETRGVFVHRTAITSESTRTRLNPGDQVEYNLWESSKGLRASDVRLMPRTSTLTTASTQNN